MNSAALPYIINALCVAFLTFNIWALGVKPLKALPGYIIFGAIIGAALTSIS
jgi:hypothetical protein